MLDAPYKFYGSTLFCVLVLIHVRKANPSHYCFRGDVVTMDCVEKIIKKDWTHPLTGEKLKEQDIIPLQRVITVAFLNDEYRICACINRT
jgi:hypothetical protein